MVCYTMILSGDNIMSEILTKFEEEMARIRADYTAFYSQFTNKEVENEVHDTNEQREDTENKED